MALPGSGPLALSAIQTEFGGSPPTSISEYYGVGGSVPSSGQIAFSNFYGATNARGFFAGGGTPAPITATNVIDTISISSTGNATDWGDMSLALRNTTSCSSSTRGLVGTGAQPSPLGATESVYYYNLASSGNTSFFGTYNTFGGAGPGAPQFVTACSNSTRGVWAGGLSPLRPPGYQPATNLMTYFTIATTGNSVNFGTLSGYLYSMVACASPTRGVFMGGQFIGGSTNNIQYITIATTGNTTDFGDLPDTFNNSAGFSNSTRGIIGDGRAGGTNIINYITIASTGNSTDFGDLSSPIYQIRGCSSPTRGVFAGGSNPSTGVHTSGMEYITMASTGNTTFFGNMTIARASLGACSNAHGGL